MAPSAVCVSAVALPVLSPGHGGRQQQKRTSGPKYLLLLGAAW